MVLNLILSNVFRRRQNNCIYNFTYLVIKNRKVKLYRCYYEADDKDFARQLLETLSSFIDLALTINDKKKLNGNQCGLHKHIVFSLSIEWRITIV